MIFTKPINPLTEYEYPEYDWTPTSYNHWFKANDIEMYLSCVNSLNTSRNERYVMTVEYLTNNIKKKPRVTVRDMLSFEIDGTTYLQILNIELSECEVHHSYRPTVYGYDNAYADHQYETSIINQHIGDQHFFQQYMKVVNKLVKELIDVWRKQIKTVVQHA